MSRQLRPAHIRLRDLVKVSGSALRSRPTRVVLAALGIAIGIAAMIGVVGISSSGSADFDRKLAKLGTNLLTVKAGSNIFGKAASMPDEAPQMISRIAPVTDVSSIGMVPNAAVYRNDRIPLERSGGIGTYAVDLDLMKTVGATLAKGQWLTKATENFPTVVLGTTTAESLGIDRVGADVQVRVGNAWFTVIGILNVAPLVPSLDSGVMVGWPVAKSLLKFDGHPTSIFTRIQEESVVAVKDVLAATANPMAANEVEVSRPSDALQAKEAANESFTGLLLGVGAVALVVGGVGVANTMVISVLERRGEIGLRRSLGATRGHIRLQFLMESFLLAMIGGIAGVIIGVAATTGYAAAQAWPVSVPMWATAGGLLATLFVGVIAGLYPAGRASRLSPTEALATP